MTGPHPGHAAVARWVGLVVLQVWGAALTWLLLTRGFLSFIRPELSLLLLLAQVLAYAISFAVVVRPRGAHASRGVLGRAALLLLPVLFLAFGARGTLGTFAYERRAVGDSALVSAPPREAGPPARGEEDRRRFPRTTVLDLLLADHGGRRVEITGQVIRGRGEPEGQFLLFRFVVTCCVADAGPLAVHVCFADQDRLVDGGWVRVFGTVGESRLGDRRVLLIDAQSVEPIEAPEDPYLYYY